MLNNPAPTSISPDNPSPPSLNAKKDISVDKGETAEDQPRTTATWISKRDRHMQLISSSVYDKETNLRQQAIDKTRQEKALRRNRREMVKIGKHLERIADNAAPIAVQHAARGTTPLYEVNINGLKFQVLEGGSKLLRDIGPYEFPA